MSDKKKLSSLDRTLEQTRLTGVESLKWHDSSLSRSAVGAALRNANKFATVSESLKSVLESHGRIMKMMGPTMELQRLLNVNNEAISAIAKATHSRAFREMDAVARHATFSIHIEIAAVSNAANARAMSEIGSIARNMALTSQNEMGKHLTVDFHAKLTPGGCGQKRPALGCRISAAALYSTPSPLLKE